MRSDKKHDIKPTISLQLKDSIYRLSYIQKRAVKDVCEDLVLNGLFGNKEILKGLTPHLKRSEIIIENTIYRGNLENESLKSFEGKTERISFRVKKEVHELLYSLSYAFGCSISKIAGVLLYESITDADFIEKYVESYLDSLDRQRKKELTTLLKYIERETEESFSLVDLLSYLAEEVIMKWNFPGD